MNYSFHVELVVVDSQTVHKKAFDLLLKEAWNPEQAAMGNSTLPTVSDKLNVMASIHNRKLIAALSRVKRKRFPDARTQTECYLT